MKNRSRGLALAIISALILSLFLPTSHSAQKITAGSSCKGLNKKVDYKNKSYTCIKKGKKLVWSKGVAIKSAAPTPTPTPTPSASPSPTSSATPTPTATTTQVQLPTEWSLCPKIGEKVVGTTTYMRCSWAGHAITQEEARQRLVWRSFPIMTISTSKSNNYSVTPVEKATCSNSGDTFDVTGGILECRWTNGKKLEWIKINTVKKSFTNAKSPVSIDTCKLQLSDSKADRTD